jgi:hypothetical protein
MAGLDPATHQINDYKARRRAMVAASGAAMTF